MVRAQDSSGSRPVEGHAGHIRTPDQRLRVFVSSTLGELAEERAAARRAIEALRLTPVMFELGARPHPARALYRAYLDQSHVFLGIYWQRYGWVAPDEEISGLEDEYLLSSELPRLVYLKDSASGRDERLDELVHRIQADDTVSYKPFSTVDEIERLITEDLAVLLSERFLEVPEDAEPGSATWGVHLPEPPSAIVGRDREIEELCRLLSDPRVRLVTLVGSGGIGKTRLGLELARSMAASFADGAVMVALQDTRNAAEVVPAVAAAMGVTFDPLARVGDALATAIGNRRVLIFLDNFEHVLDAAPALSKLLELCPNLTLVVTSRSVLGVRAEHDYLVLPLEVPDEQDEGAEGTASVRLFLERAHSVRADFAITERTRDAVFELCRRLEGIPLALELAAARVKTLTPQGLLDRLDARLELLVSTAPDAPARQRTLRATIEWSHELLTDAERRLFGRLAVFAGGFTLEAAEGVCGGEDLDVLDALSGLVEHSLVAPSASQGSVPRFRMFEMIRVFARDHLEMSGEVEALRARHLAYFEVLAAEGEPALRSVDHLQWMARVAPEWDNLRAAWQHAIDIHQTQRAASLAGCGFMLLWKQGRLREMLPLVRATRVVRDELDDNTLGRLLFAGASVSFAAGAYDESQAFVDEFAAIESSVDDQMIRGAAWLARAFLAGYRFDIDGLRRSLDEAERVFRAADELWMLSFALATRGALASLEGDEQTALEFQTEAFDLAVQTGNDAMELQSLIAQCMSHLRSGDSTNARSALRAALSYFEDYPYFESVAYAYEAGAALSLASDDSPDAARLLGAADMARRTSAAALWPLLKPQRDLTAAQVEAVLGADGFESLARAGGSLAPRDAAALLRQVID